MIKLTDAEALNWFVKVRSITPGPTARGAYLTAIKALDDRLGNKLDYIREFGPFAVDLATDEALEWFKMYIPSAVFEGKRAAYSKAIEVLKSKLLLENSSK